MVIQNLFYFSLSLTSVRFVLSFYPVRPSVRHEFFLSRHKYTYVSIQYKSLLLFYKTNSFINQLIDIDLSTFDFKINKFPSCYYRGFRIPRFRIWRNKSQKSIYRSNRYYFFCDWLFKIIVNDDNRFEIFVIFNYFIT